MRNNHTSTRQETLAQRPALSRTVLSCLLAVLLALTMMPVAGFGGAAAYAESTADAFAQNGANIIDDASDIPAQGGQPSDEEEGAGDGASGDAQDVPGEPGGGAGEADSGAQDGDNAAAPEGDASDAPEGDDPDYTWGDEGKDEGEGDDDSLDALAVGTAFTVGANSYADLPSAVKAATAELATKDQVTIQVNEDWTLTSRVDFDIPAGKTIVLESANSQFDFDAWRADNDGRGTSYRDDRHVIARADNLNSTMLSVKSGTLVLKNIIIDGKDVAVNTSGRTGFSAALAEIGVNHTTPSPASIVLDHGALMQNGKNTGGYFGTGGVAVAGPATEFKMLEGSVAQDCVGSFSGFSTMADYTTNQDTVSFTMEGGLLRGHHTDYSMGGGAISCATSNNALVTFTGSADVYDNSSNVHGSVVELNGDPLVRMVVHVSGNAKIHDNKVLKQTATNDYGQAAALSLWQDNAKVYVEMSGSPSFYNNVASDGKANDVYCSYNANAIRILGDLIPRNEQGGTGEIWFSTTYTQAEKQAFATAWNAAGTAQVPSSDYSGYGCFRNVRVDGLFGATGTGSNIVWLRVPTVTFDAQGGTFAANNRGSMDVTATGTQNNYKTPAAPENCDDPGVLAPPGLETFGGWWSLPGGQGEEYVAGAAISQPKTYFAHWIPKPSSPEETYKVVYEKGSTSLSEPVGDLPQDDRTYLKSNAGALAVVEGSELVALGHVFDGWKAADGTVFQAGDKITYSDDLASSVPIGDAATVTLTAQWRQADADEVFSVDYRPGAAPQGETVSGFAPFDGIDSVQRSYLRDGGSATVLGQGDLSVSGDYEFAGWALTDGASTPEFTEDSAISYSAKNDADGDGRIVLFGVWRPLVSAETVFSVERPDLGDRLEFAGANALRDALKAAENYLNGNDPATTGLGILQPVADFFTGYGDDRAMVAAERSEVVIKQWKDYTVPAQATANIPAGKTIVLDGQKGSFDGSGHISIGGAKNFTMVNVAGTGTFETRHVTLTGGKSENKAASKGQMFAVAGKSSLILSDGTLLEEGMASDGGGAIYLNRGDISSPTKLIMQGDARIENCSARNAGGAVYAGSYGDTLWYTDIVLDDTASIANCEAGAGNGHGGGGIYQGNKSSLLMKGNSLIEGCRTVKAADYNGGGGGISQRPEGSLVLTENAAIRNCGSAFDGGGIYQEGLRYGYLELSGNAEITGCWADQYGSAIHTGNDATGLVVIKDNVRITDNAVFRSSEYGALLNWSTRIRLEGSPYIWDNTVDADKDRKGDGVVQSNLRTKSDVVGNAQVVADLAGGKVGVSTSHKAKGQQFATAWMPDGMEGALNIGQAGVASDLSGLGHLVNDANSALWGAAGTGSAIVWSDEMTATFDANGGMFNADGSTLLSKDADGASGAWKTPAAPTNADVTGAPDYQRLVPGNEWNSAKDGSGDVYAAGEPMTAPVTAYAQWEIDPNAEFNLTYDANGGHFGADANDTERAVGPIAWDKQTPPAAPAFGEKPTRDETYTDEQGAEQPRYEFLGWSTSSSLAAKVDFEPGVTQLTSKNQRVYAVWKDNSPDPDDESPWQLYVSEDTGDDTNGNGTQAKPYRTFKRAFEVVHNHASLFSTHGEYADGARPTAAPKDPDYPTLAWATVILMDDWKFGDKTTNAAGNNRGYVAVPQNVLSGSITVRGMDGVKNIALDATTVANVDLFQAPANTKLVLKHLTIDGAGVEGDHQAVYLSGRSDLTLGYGLTLQNWTSTQAPAIHAANMGARNNVNFGEIVMRNNSTIDNCKSTRATTYDDGYRDVSGGAVLLRNAVTMIMENGSAITNCSSNGTAGAIYLRGYDAAVDAAGNTIGAASLYMMEGSLIDNCTAKTHGGAMYTTYYADLQIAGTISNCSAETGGGIAAYWGYPDTVYHEYSRARLHGGVHILDGAHIVDCKATGTFVNKNGCDSLIPSYGEEVGYGGAFAGGQGWGSFMIKGGTIERCSAPNGLGGVSASYGWTVFMDDGMVRDCSALAGGAFVLSEGFMFLGGTIEGCQATGDPAQSHNFSSTINGQGGAMLGLNDEGGLIMDVTIRDCSATAAGGAMSFPHDFYTPPDGPAKGTVPNVVINHETSFDIFGITIEGCTAPVGAAIAMPGEGTQLSSQFRVMDMSRIAPGGAVRAMFNRDDYNKDRVDEILTPKAPIVIEDNYTPDGQPSNIQTLQKRYGNVADWTNYDWLTMITNMNGEPLPGSYIGFTTGYSTADMAKFNKEGDAFARTNKADGSVDFISSLYSDKDASLIPVWGTKADANLVWKQGWAFLFDENKPGEVTEVEGMPTAQHAALENTMGIPQQVPTDATPGTDDADKWVFAGWATSPNGAVEFYPGDVVGPYDNIKAQLDPDGDHRITLYAVWTPPDPELFFTVTYEKGETPDGSPISGTVPVDDNRYYKGPNADGTGEFTVMGNEGDPRLTADGGWRFRGWATEPGVDPEANPEKVFAPGSKVSFNEANGQNIANDYGRVTLYAVWGEVADDEWSVVYERGSAWTTDGKVDNVVVTGKVPVDDTIYKKGNPPAGGNEADPYTDGDEAEIMYEGGMSAAGYQFLGWAMPDDPGRVVYLPNDDAPYVKAHDKADGAEDGVVTLVGVWVPDDGRVFTLVETFEGFKDLNQSVGFNGGLAPQRAIQAAKKWMKGEDAWNARIVQHVDYVLNPASDNDPIVSYSWRDDLPFASHGNYSSTLSPMKDRTITFNGLGHDFLFDTTRAPRGSAFAVAFGTLEFVNGTYHGNQPDSTLVGIIANGQFSGIYNNARVVIGKDAIIEGFKSDNCGAFHLRDDFSELVLEKNSRVTNCRAEDDGGAIFTEHDGVIYMRDDAVIDNCYTLTTDRAWGGAVALRGNNSALIMDDNASIRDCWTYVGGSYSYGGAVYAEGKSAIIMRGDSSIENCKSAKQGSAVWVRSGSSLTMQGTASITGNGWHDGITNGVGAVYLDNNAYMYVQDAPTVDGNAGSAGGPTNIYVADNRTDAIRVTGELYGGSLKVDSLPAKNGQQFGVAWSEAPTGWETATVGQAVENGEYNGYYFFNNDNDATLFGAPGTGSAIIWSDRPHVVFDAKGGVFADGFHTKAVFADKAPGWTEENPKWQYPAAPGEVPTKLDESTNPAGRYIFDGWWTKDGSDTGDWGDEYALLVGTSMNVVQQRVYANWQDPDTSVSAAFTKVGADQDTGVYQKLGGATFNVYKFTGNQAELNENTINTDAIKLAGELGGWSNQWLPLLNVNDTPTLGATPKPGAGETLYSFTSSLDAQTMGTVQLSGLVPNQWYMLVETKAPSAAGDSYQMTTGQWAFQVIDDGNGGYTINLDSASPTRVLSKEGTDGQLPPAFAKKLDGVGEGAFCVNVPVFDLPMAGVPFAISMLLLGAVAVAGVVSWSLVKRRKVE